MELYSNAFNNNDSIPSKYTCEGKNISPQLHWKDIPAETKSFALIMDDPDAPMGTWVHWVLYNLPADTRSLDEDATKLPPGTETGINSWRKNEYGGPCPPAGGPHHYNFKLYALNTMLDISGNITSEKLQGAMKDHVLATVTLVGTYGRSNP